METNHSTKLNFTLALTRMVVGFVVLSHGVQKLFGWFGGYGFEGTMGFFTNTIGLPYAFGVLIIIAETFGMLALIAGLFTRFLSIAMALIMLGAIFTTHGQFGYYMNWSGALKGEGFEFHILLIALSLVNAVNGAGAWSLDTIWGKKAFKTKKSPQTEVA